MKKHLLAIAICFSAFFLSCKSLPDIQSYKTGERKPDSSIFLEEKYQLTHSIKAELPNGEKLLLIGVTVIDPEERPINAVILTVDGGLVLFDISYKDNTTVINRSMPDFDSSGFATGLMDDLKLIFFPPDCPESESGKVKEMSVIRYKCNDGMVVDISAGNNREAEILKYSRSNSVTRSVNLLFNQQGMPDKIELTAHGLFGYSLYMDLISAEKI